MSRLAIAFAALALLLPRLARASAADVFGLSSEESAVAGASTARVHDFTAGHYDPAALVRVERPEMSFGVLGFGSQLTVNGRVRPIEEPVGVVVGAATPVPLGWKLRDRIFVGIALYLLPDAIVRVISQTPDQPFFATYDNRTQRLIVLPSVAVRLWGGLSAGVAVNYLAGLAGQVAAGEGTTRAVEARVDEQIVSLARVNAGLLWRSPRDRVSVGFTYRQAFGVPFTTVTQNKVAGQPIDVNVDAEGLFTPHTFVLGAAVRALPSLQLSLDTGVALWSLWRGPYVTVSSTLPVAGVIDTAPPHLDFRDTVCVRLGAEWTRDLGRRVTLALRGGYAFETSPVPDDQPGVTNLLDGDKHTVAAGAGVAIALGAVHLRIDAHGQIQALQPVTLEKRIAPDGTDPAKGLRDLVPDDPRNPATLGAQIDNPGYPSIRGAGYVWAAGLTLTVAR